MLNRCKQRYQAADMALPDGIRRAQEFRFLAARCSIEIARILHRECRMQCQTCPTQTIHWVNAQKCQHSYLYAAFHFLMGFFSARPGVVENLCPKDLDAPFS